MGEGTLKTRMNLVVCKSLSLYIVSCSVFLTMLYLSLVGLAALNFITCFMMIAAFQLHLSPSAIVVDIFAAASMTNTLFSHL